MAKRRFASAAKAADKPLNKPNTSAISKSTQPTLHRGRKRRLQKKHNMQQKNEFIQAELERIEHDKNIARKDKQDPILKSLKDLSGVLELDATSREEETLPKRGDDKKRKLSAKQRLRIVEAEREQIKLVQTHEAYVKNPMEALRRHLNNTVCPNGLEVPKNDIVLTKKCNHNEQHNKDEKKAKDKHTKRAKNKSLTINEAALQKAREEARERVESKRQYKQALSEVVRRRSAKHKVSKIQKQKASSLLSRSRIGVKRTKVL